MLRRLTTINKRGIQRFMHTHKPVEEKEAMYCFVEWKKLEKNQVEMASQLNKMDAQIEALTKEVVEHNKKVVLAGEFTGIGLVSFAVGFGVTHFMVTGFKLFFN